MLKQLQAPLEGILEFALLATARKSLLYPVDVLEPEFQRILPFVRLDLLFVFAGVERETGGQERAKRTNNNSPSPRQQLVMFFLSFLRIQRELQQTNIPTPR